MRFSQPLHHRCNGSDAIGGMLDVRVDNAAGAFAADNGVHLVHFLHYPSDTDFGAVERHAVFVGDII